VARLRLSAEEASVARDDLADVRVVDAGGRQWPYLVGDRSAAEERDIAVERETHDERVSHYRLQLPASPIRIEALTLETDETFIDRPFRLVAIRAGDPEKKQQPAASGRLVRRSRDRAPTRPSYSPLSRARRSGRRGLFGVTLPPTSTSVFAKSAPK
jgi:hypothetical protein